MVVTEDKTRCKTIYFSSAQVRMTYVSFQGYRHSNAYIVTQWPLRSTINDIWRLVYDYNIPTLVLLNDMSVSRVSVAKM